MNLSIKKIQTGYMFILSIFLTNISNAQVDTIFWFAAHEVTQTHGDEPIYLQVATLNNPSNVTITIPAAGITIANNFPIAANSSNTFNLSPWKATLETAIGSINQPNNKGVLITATDYITAYYEVLGKSSAGRIVNTDIFALKGNNSLGKEFYVPFQNRFFNIGFDFWGNNMDGRSTIDIVATEDNTTITVTPTQPYRVGAGSSMAPINITLNRGQTYSIEAFGKSAAAHMAGTYIVSNKKIAVTMKDDSIGETTQAYDLAGDQIIPVNRTGTEYIVFSGYAFLVATEDNTTISKNGVDQGVNLMKGQTYSIDLTADPNAAYITTSKPAYMNHLIKIDGEMANAVVPPLQCTGSTYVTVNRSSFNYREIFYLFIAVEAGAENSFTLTNSVFPTGTTNTVINGASFTPVAGTGGAWLFDTLEFNNLSEVPLGSNIISNSAGIFHLGILNGKKVTTGAADPNDNSATGFRYGYFTDFGNLALNLNIPDQCIATGDSIQIYPGDYQSYDWSTGSTDTAIYIKQSGTFTVTVTNVDGCEGTSDFSVQLDQTPDFSLGPDVMLCKEEPMILVAKNTNFSQLSNVVFSWNTGTSTDSTLAISQAGTYILTATNGCGQYSDTVNIQMLPITTNNLFTPNGDAHNETFVLNGLQQIGEWELNIYNRWGERVYKSNLYKNEWDGVNVNEGTYYYKFIDKSGQCPEKNGWVHLVR
ncbi:MAG: gliding motility-associated C-terminal domain-containing protein [Cytophagaceae bacterium]|nr:gliding motility-associated C-terminal domain-containing protein [Cytophagaceae bacterium]